MSILDASRSRLGNSEGCYSEKPNAESLFRRRSNLVRRSGKSAFTDENDHSRRLVLPHPEACETSPRGCPLRIAVAPTRRVRGLGMLLAIHSHRTCRNDNRAGTKPTPAPEPQPQPETWCPSWGQVTSRHTPLWRPYRLAVCVFFFRWATTVGGHEDSICNLGLRSFAYCSHLKCSATQLI